MFRLKNLTIISAQEAEIWVNVTRIPGSATDYGLGNGTATLFMYYGNPDVESESDANNTFEYYVNFSASGIQSAYGGQDAHPNA